MHARMLHARRTCLLLINAERDKEGRGGWKERHAALLELVVTLSCTALLCTALLCKKQDRIAKAVVCYEEALLRPRSAACHGRVCFV